MTDPRFFVPIVLFALGIFTGAGFALGLIESAEMLCLDGLERGITRKMALGLGLYCVFVCAGSFSVLLPEVIARALGIFQFGLLANVVVRSGTRITVDLGSTVGWLLGLTISILVLGSPAHVDH
ncbi:hypothetical protein [Paraburkholderia sp. BCC1885]|uniref:hypothetical protein n=1 Tax=Paraburkholderia sp. BCC1885 TaxID=2562669 RepID=UPI0011832C7E|nr:hypothetical protein [Paraburkholderia sp. BCC1885]